MKLGPYETARIDVREALGPSANGAMGGLTLSLPNKEGISASEIVFDETTGFAATMKLFERYADEKVTNHVLRAPMMALTQPDPSLAFPQGTVLVPHLFLRNAGQSSLPVSVAVDWRSENTLGTYQVPALNLKPGELKTLDLGQLQRAGSIPASAMWSTVRLSYTGKSTDLIPVALSYDASSRYGLQTPFTEGTNRVFKGSMWHVDSTHNSLITTGNGGSEATSAQVTLFYNGGQSQYRVEKLLAPGQQMWLDVGQLIRNQVPDSDGKTMKPDTMTGSYELRDLDHATVGLLYEGKLIVDKTYGHAAYGCALCCGYVKTELTPSPFSGPPGIDNLDYFQAEEQCGAYWDDVTNSASGWQSSNTSVATLPTRTLHTVAVGTASGSASQWLQGAKPAPLCPAYFFGPNQSVNVTPVITSINPQTGVVGATVQVTISGSGFGSSAGNVTTTAGSQIQVAIKSWNDGQIGVTFTISSIAATGNYTVVVTTAASAACPSCQAQTSFYVTAQCNPSVFTPSPSPIACDGKTVRQAQLVVAGVDESNVTNTVVSATSSNILTVDLQGSPYKNSASCQPGQICYGQNYIGYTNSQSKSANINWSVQIFCSNSPYPSETVNQAATITCQ